MCDRTPGVRNAIVLAASSTGCADVTTQNLAAITTLDASSLGLGSLREGDFDGLTALTTLSLNDNSLSSLPAGVFSDRTALTSCR